MPEIHVRRKHKLGLRKARGAAQHIADELSSAFAVRSHWQGNVLHFARAGVSGELTVASDHVELTARLGLLLSALKPRIEQSIGSNLDKYFG